MERGFIVELQTSQQPFQDVLVPVKNRAGYKEGAIPTIPVYFYRHIGVNGLGTIEQDAFLNQIYELNNQLMKHPSGYIKFEQTIPMPKPEEINKVLSFIRNILPDLYPTLKGGIVSQTIKSNVLNVFSKEPLNQNVRVAFDKVMDLYMRNERQINPSKIENFVLKMIVWLKRYSTSLFKGTTLSDVPKVLFYGDIKTHEVYFLTLLALIGVDVLFIHTDKSKDSPFEKVDANGVYAKKIELPESMELPPFPIMERVIRKSTVAYNASKEIERVLYGADVGLFKAWQYETGVTKAVTLKTTYDELKMLWKEEAKFRPEFAVKDNKVYVPNLFAKINGVPEDLSDYWEDIHELIQEDYTVLFKEVPFTKVNYTRQELYSTAFLFTPDGVVDKEALYRSPVYKLHYLKSSIQDLIVYKINELLLSPIFINEINEKMRLKILMTIITMDERLLRLIESFDFTGKVPKIVIYSNQRTTFSEEDIIILAFFNLLGADILIFTPTNYNNIEHGIKREYFDIHQLPYVQFDLAWSDKWSATSKIRLKNLFRKFLK
jgi:hypothetical protein